MPKPVQCFLGGLLLLHLSCGAVPALAQPAPAQAEAPINRLHTELERIAAAANGVVGVSAWRLDGLGPRVALNAEQRFPMASTFKVAVAGAILAKVDEGELSLDRMVSVPPERLVPSDVIANRLIHPGVALSIHNLLELMITESDNTATDILTDVAGGPQAVTHWLRKQGIENQRMDRDTSQLLRAFFGLPPGPIGPAFAEATRRDSKIGQRGELPNPSFDDDPRDTSTPEAMSSLLARIYRGEALSDRSTTILTGIMDRTRTGKMRIEGRLPLGTAVAHKTGTIGGVVADVGVITLPGKSGEKIVASFFVKKSAVPIATRERVIADLARAIYDFYLFSSPAR